MFNNEKKVIIMEKSLREKDAEIAKIWLAKFNKEVREMNLPPKVKDKLIIPKLNSSYFSYKEEVLPKPKKKKKKKTYVQSVKPIKQNSKLIDFENKLLNLNKNGNN